MVRVVGRDRKLGLVHLDYGLKQLWVTEEPEHVKYDGFREAPEVSMVKAMIAPTEKTRTIDGHLGDMGHFLVDVTYEHLDDSVRLKKARTLMFGKVVDILPQLTESARREYIELIKKGERS